MIHVHYARKPKRVIMIQGDGVILMDMSEARQALHDIQDAVWSYENDMIDKEETSDEECPY